MTISDIITIISLVIAIVAIISEKKRKHLLLKFGYFVLGLYILAFLLINYFVFYNQFYSNDYYLHFLYFQNFGLSNPSYYSYIISIFILISVLYKILYSFYPYWKKNKVIEYYRSLIENNEIPLLLDIIDKYHTQDIRKYVTSHENYDLKSDDFLDERFRKIKLKEKVFNIFKLFWLNINPYSRANRYSYASYILNNIINDPAFIIFASNVRPYLFAKIFETFKKEKKSAFPNDLVNSFLTEILKSKNYWLIKELKQSENFDFGLQESFFEENKIIASLLHNVSVADVNNIWIPFGEEALKEIEKEKNIGIESKLYQEYRNDDILWEFKTYISIKFFKILIIESIVHNYSGTHFHLHYYWLITEKILKNFLSSPTGEIEKTDSNYHYLIIEMNNNLFHWLKLANEHQADIFHDIIDCIGNQIDCITKSPFFGNERTIDFIVRVLNHYCSLNEKAKTDLIRNKLDEILNKPSILTKPNDPYYTYISLAWVKFYKYRYRNDDEDFDYFSRLKNNVIIPLGLNPDEQ